MKTLAKRFLRQFGYDIVRYSKAPEIPSFPRDFTEDEKEICRLVAPFTLTSVACIVGLIRAIRYLTENRIAGEIVECGVWRGGSMMVVAHVLQRLGDTARKLYLYDTFAGMPAPTGKDIRYDGVRANQLLNETAQGTVLEDYTNRDDVRAYASSRDVATNLRSTGYPEHNIHLIEGRVEDTIPSTVPNRISLLRLDTDWYESTRHELIHLYPRLEKYGVLIIDDYGYWQGAKEATDEYFGQSKHKPFLHRIDTIARLVIKTHE